MISPKDAASVCRNETVKWREDCNSINQSFLAAKGLCHCRYTHQPEAEEKRQPGGEGNSGELPDAHRGGEEAGGDGKENGIGKGQNHAEKVSKRDAANQHLQRQQGQNGK